MLRVLSNSQTIYIPNDHIKLKLNIIKPPLPPPLSEINKFEHYKTALALLLSYRDEFPNNITILHLHGEKPNNPAYIDRIYKLATKLGIIIIETPSSSCNTNDTFCNPNQTIKTNDYISSSIYDCHKSYFSYNGCGNYYNYDNYKCDTGTSKYSKPENTKNKFIPKIKLYYQNQCIQIYEQMLEEAIHLCKTSSNPLKLDVKQLKSSTRKIKNQVLHDFYTKLKIHNPEAFKIHRRKKTDHTIQEFINQMYMVSDTTLTSSSDIYNHYKQWLTDNHPTEKIRTLSTFSKTLYITTINGKHITTSPNGKKPCCRIVKKPFVTTYKTNVDCEKVISCKTAKIRVRRAKPDRIVEEFINQIYTGSVFSTPSRDIYNHYKCWMELTHPSDPIKPKITFGTILRITHLNGEKMVKSRNGKQQGWRIIRK